MSENIRPLADRVLVKPNPAETQTAGGIVIPETAGQEKPGAGTVVATGHGKCLSDGKIQPLQIKKGDRILFGKYAGTSIKLDGQEFLIMREEDVMAIVE